MAEFRILPPQLEINPDDPFGKDIFHLSEMADGLSNVVLSIKQPLVIAFDGPWGSGKSTFLKQWKAKLENEKPDIPVIYFDAFENDYVEDAFAALVREVVALIEARSGVGLRDFKDKAIACGTILMKAGLRLGIKAGTRAITFNLAKDEDIREILKDLQGESADAANAILEELLSEPNKQRNTIQEFRLSLSRLSSSMTGNDGSAFPLIFIIDELDRCRPAFALSILERIKHFMSVPNVHFVLGVHLEQLRNSVRSEYGSGIDAHLYLQKFLSMTISMPAQNDDLYPGRHAAYIKYLRSAISPDAASNNFIDKSADYLAKIAQNRNFSLRTLEKAYSYVVLYALFTKENQLRLDFAIAALSSLKVTSPELYQKARLGTLSFQEIATSIGLNEKAPKDSAEKWEIKWWHFLLDEVDPKDAQELNNTLFRYGFNNRRDLVPFFVSNIERLKA